jgi:rod shape-determining protein MreD
LEVESRKADVFTSGFQLSPFNLQLHRMRRTLVLFATLALLWLLVAQANHYLAVWHAYLYVGGLFVAYAALYAPLRDGLVATILGGLLCDASTPAAFGTQMLLFTLAFLAIYRIRDRVPREENLVRVLVALATNLGLFIAFSVSQLGRTPPPGGVWWRLICDLFYSEAVILLIAPWFFALQTRALQLAREKLSAFD